MVIKKLINLKNPCRCVGTIETGDVEVHTWRVRPRMGGGRGLESLKTRGDVVETGV